MKILKCDFGLSCGFHFLDCFVVALPLPRNDGVKIRHCEGDSSKQSMKQKMDCHESATQILAMTKYCNFAFDL